MKNETARVSNDKGKQGIQTKRFALLYVILISVTVFVVFFALLSSSRPTYRSSDDIPTGQITRTQSTCSTGWKCKDAYTKAYQSSDCSWTSIIHCEYGCENGNCCRYEDEPYTVEVPYETQEAYSTKEPIITEHCYEKTPEYTLRTYADTLYDGTPITLIEICNKESQSITVSYRVCTYGECAENRAYEAINANSCNDPKPTRSYIVASINNVEITSELAPKIKICSEQTEYRDVTKYRTVTKYKTETKYESVLKCD